MGGCRDGRSWSSHKTETVPPAAPERSQRKKKEKRKKKGSVSKRAARKKNLNFNCEGRNAFQKRHTGGDTIFHAHKWKQCTDEGWSPVRRGSTLVFVDAVYVGVFFANVKVAKEISIKAERRRTDTRTHTHTQLAHTSIFYLSSTTPRAPRHHRRPSPSPQAAVSLRCDVNKPHTSSHPAPFCLLTLPPRPSPSPHPRRALLFSPLFPSPSGRRHPASNAESRAPAIGSSVDMELSMATDGGPKTLTLCVLLLSSLPLCLAC